MMERLAWVEERLPICGLPMDDVDVLAKEEQEQEALSESPDRPAQSIKWR